MPISDMIARNAKPKEKQYKITDFDSLFLLVKVTGKKYWQFKYRFAGAEKILSIGVYPKVSLKEARDKRDEAQRLLRAGIDPNAHKQEEKRKRILNAANSFESVAREWIEVQKGKWTEKHRLATLKRMERNLFPSLGRRPIKDITPPELLNTLRKMESRDAIDLAHRGQQTAGQVFRYAIVTGRAERDISQDLQGALKTRKKVHHAYLTEEDLPEFLQRLERYDGDKQTKIATKLLLLTFVRTSELRGARWSEFNFSKAEWRIPAERMKMRETHIVPLSRQAQALFEEQRRSTGNDEFVFPNRCRPSSCMSQNTIIFALYRMGYHSRTTAHGFRATASTILHEQGINSEVIERQLAHAKRNKVRASYDHSQLLMPRTQLMQHWADYLERLSECGTDTTTMIPQNTNFLRNADCEVPFFKPAVILPTAYSFN